MELKVFSVFKVLFVVFETSRDKMKKLLIVLISFVVTAPLCGPLAMAFQAQQPECLVAAKAGGGMDLTCQLVAKALLTSNLIDTPMSVRYKTGGIGAVAYNHVIGIRNNDPQLIVAASSGSALNIATQKFGHYDVSDVRWLGAVAADYGVIAVRHDSVWNSLNDLIVKLRNAPTAINIGGSGSIGSQDWMKAALLAQEGGIDPAKIRYVGFEGPKDATEALINGYIDIFPGDAAELKVALAEGKIKILAVLTDHRLPAIFAHIPTAREQGFLVDWTIWRGFYMGPQVSDESYQWWVNTLKRLARTPEFQHQRDAVGLYPFTKLGQEFSAFVEDTVTKQKELAVGIGLIK